MQQETLDMQARQSKRIKEILMGAGTVVLVLGFAILSCYLIYIFDLEPLKRSFLGTPLIFDPDGLSVYERACTLFGWV